MEGCPWSRCSSSRYSNSSRSGPSAGQRCLLYPANAPPGLASHPRVNATTIKPAPQRLSNVFADLQQCFTPYIAGAVGPRILAFMPNSGRPKMTITAYASTVDPQDAVALL